MLAVDSALPQNWRHGAPSPPSDTLENGGVSKPGQAVVTVANEDFWQQKHEQSIAHLLKQDSNTTTNGNAKLPFRVVSASDNSDLINFSSSSLHQETEIAAEERELDRALQSSAQISSLARFDSAVSLDNTDFSCSSNSSTADDIIHNNSGDPSVWPWSSDFSLPDSPGSGSDVACEEESAKMARNIFLLPSFSSQDESGLRDIVEAVALEASTKAGGGTALHETALQLSQCLKAGMGGLVGDDSDSSSEDDEEEDGNDDVARCQCSCTDSESEGERAGASDEDSAKLPNVVPNGARAGSSIGVNSTVLSGLVTPDTLRGFAPSFLQSRPFRSQGTHTSQAPVSIDDSPPIGVFTGVMMPSNPSIVPTYQVYSHTNLPHPGTTFASRPPNGQYCPPKFYHSLSANDVALASATAMATGRTMHMNYTQPHVGFVPQADSESEDDRDDGDGEEEDDNDAGDFDDDQVETEDGVKPVRVRRVTVDRGHRHSIPSPLQLWEYLLHILELGKYSAYIRWIDCDDGSFKIYDSVHLGRQWGLYRHKPRMNYDKMSRAMRYYYKRNIFVKIEGRLLYQFSDEVMRQVRSYRKKSTGRRRQR